KKHESWLRKLRDHRGVVDAEAISRVVAESAQIPPDWIRWREEGAQKLLNLEADLGDQVVGQRQAISTVARALRHGMAIRNRPRRPLAALLCLGPAGVGKTWLARCLSDHLFGIGSLATIDLSYFHDPDGVGALRHALSRGHGAGPLSFPSGRWPPRV